MGYLVSPIGPTNCTQLLDYTRQWYNLIAVIATYSSLIFFTGCGSARVMYGRARFMNKQRKPSIGCFITTLISSMVCYTCEHQALVELLITHKSCYCCSCCGDCRYDASSNQLRFQPIHRLNAIHHSSQVLPRKDKHNTQGKQVIKCSQMLQ